MIARVVQAARAARSVSRVLVATDHAEIAAAAQRAGAEAVMTDSGLQTGTDRVAAALRISGTSADIVVNVQGDEPFMPPEAIDLAVQLLARHAEAEIATLSAPLRARDLLDSNKVKVVCAAPAGADALGSRALCFSRAPIGIGREALGALLDPRGAAGTAGPEPAGTVDGSSGPIPDHGCRLHVGLYAFRAAALQQFVGLPPSPLERLEQLEQLRALEAGMHIVVGEVGGGWPGGVDTPEDLRRAHAHYAETGWPASSDQSAGSGQPAG
jgi:3-deoxy-manno-octulosonate cytidylyltransferase (CMP-KDO synthetase)